MTTRLFRPSSRTGSSNQVAIDRLKNREIVNRFNGATTSTFRGFAGNFETFGPVGDYSTGINGDGIGNAFFVNYLGSTAILSDKDSFWRGDSTAGENARNLHVNFYNCSLIIQSRDSPADEAILWFLQGGGTAGTSPLNVADIDGRVSIGIQGNGQSFNFYGCDITVIGTVNTESNPYIFPVTDCFHSSITFVNDDTGPTGFGITNPVIGLTRGSRVFSSTFTKKTTGNLVPGEVICYGENELFEEVNMSNFRLNVGNGVGVLNPLNCTFTPGNQGGTFRYASTTTGAINGYGQDDRIIYAIGGMPTAATGTVFGTTNAAYLRQGGTNFGGVINYGGWRPQFWSDLDRTMPLSGVQVRVGSNVPLLDFTRTPSKTNLNSAISTPNTDVNQSGLPVNYVYQVQSNTQGVLDLTGGVDSSSDGGTTFPSALSDIIWDWFRLGARAAADSTAFATTFDNFNSPVSTVIVPIQEIRNNAYHQYLGTLEARHYRSTAILPLTSVSGVIGTGEGQQTFDAPIEIEDIDVIGLNDLWNATTNPTGTLVASTPQQALSLFAISFTYSAQNISDYLKACLLYTSPSPRDS